MRIACFFLRLPFERDASGNRRRARCSMLFLRGQQKHTVSDRAEEEVTMPVDPQVPRISISGLIFVAFGVAAIVLGSAYPLGTAARMGPGYFPRILGIGLLIVLGAALVTARAARSKGEPIAGVELATRVGRARQRGSLRLLVYCRSGWCCRP